jgi:hypothetical protein
VRRTIADKRNAVVSALQDPEYVDLTTKRLLVPQETIAEEFRVAQSLVSNIMRERDIQSMRPQEHPAKYLRDTSPLPTNDALLTEYEDLPIQATLQGR